MIKLKDIIYEVFDRSWNIDQAQHIAIKLNAKIVGSVAKKGKSLHDLDLRIDNNDIISITKILNKLGFESYGSQVVSPEEAKKSKKPYGKGWQRGYYFINRNGKMIQIWMDQI